MGDTNRIKMKINKKTSSLFILGVILFSSINLISAFAISAPFMENKEIYIQPGQTVNLQFNIQNGGGATSDITVQVGITEGSEIIEITDANDIYAIPAGLDANSNVRITIPADDSIGKNYSVKLSFNIIVGDVGGAFAFGSSIGQRFTVIVGEKPGSIPAEITEDKEEISLQPSDLDLGNTTRIIIAIVLIIIVIGIIYYLRNKDKRKKRRNFK